MAFLTNFDISGYGLSAQRFRISVISSNIANANTTRTSEGGPYQRRDVVFRAIDFDAALNQELKSSSNMLEYENPLDDPFLQREANPAIMSVIVDKVVRDDSDFKLRYNPSHPDANEQGYVAFPNINPVIEMADLIEATRAYQANVAAFESAKNMANSSINMMKG